MVSRVISSIAMDPKITSRRRPGVLKSLVLLFVSEKRRNSLERCLGAALRWWISAINYYIKASNSNLPLEAWKY